MFIMARDNLFLNVTRCLCQNSEKLPCALKQLYEIKQHVCHCIFSEGFLCNLCLRSLLSLPISGVCKGMDGSACAILKIINWRNIDKPI